MADQGKKEKEPSGSPKMLLVALALTNLLSLAGLGYFVLVQGGDKAQASTATAPHEAGEGDGKETADVGSMVELGTFNITLADEGQNRYLKAVLKARVSSSAVMDEIEGRDPELRDRVIDYLSSLTVKETQGAQSKATIRSNLQKRINNILRAGEVESVFLTEFVTQ